MKRPTKVLVLVLLLCLPRVSKATSVGNVVSWFSNSLDELTFTCQTAVVKLDIVDANIAQVRMEPTGLAFNTNASFTVVEQWTPPPISVTDSSNLTTITTAGMSVEVSKSPFHLTFLNAGGTVLLTDTNTTGLAFTDSRSTSNRTALFSMPANEQYYGLGLILGYPFSYRGQSRTLYNARDGFQSGDMTAMAVPLVVSSKGYGVFFDNTYSQAWNFTLSSDTEWENVLSAGELNYYFIAGNSAADTLGRYTQMTGRALLPPRWALGYIQSRYGYTNWWDMFTADAAFRSNDLPCDALVLDLYWYGQPDQMGGLTWDTTHFPNPTSNLTALANNGFKVMNIQEEYINNANAPALANFNAAATQHYLVSTNPGMTSPSIQENSGFYDSAGYFDFSNPAARAWWFSKILAYTTNGIAAHWTDLGEPEQDTTTDYLYNGHREAEIHNVYSLLWHQALAEGYATNLPNQRLYILSRSGFAGDQRFGAGHWTNDTGSDWPTLAAHPNALCDYMFSGLSYFGSDIGGFSGTPTDELYTRWFQFGAFCPIFRAHGVDSKPTAPYQFDLYVQDDCRNMLKLRYRLLPYIYSTARAIVDTGLPLCRPLALAYPNDSNVLTTGTEYMFGPNILVAPVTTQGATTENIYLPAGNWIDHWSGKALAGPRTVANYPAPILWIPVFYQDNSIIPLGPYVASSQFDDGSQRALRIYCSTNASCTLYDDDGASNGYRSNEMATTTINASFSNNVTTVAIGGAAGVYTNQPGQRTWGLEIYCTNAVRTVQADGVLLTNVPGAAELAAANSGYYLDGAQDLLRIKLPPAPITQPHTVTAWLNPLAPPAYEARINCGGRPYLDQSGAMWTADQPYSAGSFGFSGGSSNIIPNAIAGTGDPVLYQSEHNGTAFSYRFDCPNGQYEIQLLDAETYWHAAGQRLFNLSINGAQVLSNFDIFAASGGSNTAITVMFTNTVTTGEILMQFQGVATLFDTNARASGIRVRKIADADSDADGIPDWWTQAYFGHPTGQSNDLSLATDDADGDGMDNLEKYLAGVNPLDSSTSFLITGTGIDESNDVVVTFNSVNGEVYCLQQTDDLISGVWTNIETNLIGPGGIMSAIDPGAGGVTQSFYRMAAMPSP